MPYISTRGSGAVTAPEAVLRGIAPDGGLYVPVSLPALSREDILSLAEGGYPACAARVLSWLLDGYSLDELSSAAGKAYARFESADTVPITELSGNRFVLELFHGPTLAFKDMALQMLPYLMAAARAKCGETREIAILTATSGDTGKAALEAFRDVEGTSVTVFYPENGVSDMQKMQMATARGANVHVVAVRGNFDDAQTGVKKLFADAAFNEQMHRAGRVLSSANSINLGRLAPQVAYYLYACARLLRTEEAWETGLNAVIPTGNFGNILAAWYARRMGAPIKTLICASNRNHVLTDFIRTGVYDRNRDFFKTLSPSMDILIASNLERFLFELADGDASMLRGWMDNLKTTGRYDIGDHCRHALQSVLYGGFADDARTGRTIRAAFDREHYLFDPHTAVAYAVGEDYRRETGDDRPLLIAATASPFKFAADVLSALGERESDPFRAADRLSALSGLHCPAPLAELKTLPVLHTRVCEKDHMAQAVLSGFVR